MTVNVAIGENSQDPERPLGDDPLDETAELTKDFEESVASVE
jgi:hypothetical protein